MRILTLNPLKRWLHAILPAAMLALSLCPLPAGAVVRGSVHGLTSSQLQQLRQLPMRAVLPGAIPAGYQLKSFQVTLGKEAGYQLDYRCFCSGANFTINLIGTSRPFKPAKPASQSESLLVKGLGTHLKLAQYPPTLGITQSFYLSSWLSKPPLQIGVLSSFEGHAAPKSDLHLFLQGLIYLP